MKNIILLLSLISSIAFAAQPSKIILSCVPSTDSQQAEASQVKVTIQGTITLFNQDPGVYGGTGTLDSIQVDDQVLKNVALESVLFLPADEGTLTVQVNFPDQSNQFLTLPMNDLAHSTILLDYLNPDKTKTGLIDCSKTVIQQ